MGKIISKRGRSAQTEVDFEFPLLDDDHNNEVDFELDNNYSPPLPNHDWPFPSPPPAPSPGKSNDPFGNESFEVDLSPDDWVLGGLNEVCGVSYLERQWDYYFSPGFDAYTILAEEPTDTWTGHVILSVKFVQSLKMPLKQYLGGKIHS
jgi:hypothetical protein